MKKILLIFLLFGIDLVLYSQDNLSSLRTSKQIVTVENVSPCYTIQVLALTLPPSDANFFKNLDVVYEYPCSDGYVRYCVGKYNSFSEANAQLASIRENGYSEAFVVNSKRFNVSSTSSTASSVSSSYRIKDKSEIDPNKDYVVQLAAFRYPVYLTFFENVDVVYEYRLNDKIFRYTTEPVKGSQVVDLETKMRNMGYKSAFIVDYSVYSPFKIE